MKAISANSAKWIDAAHTKLELRVLFDELESLGEVPFSCQEQSDTEHGLDVFARSVAGEFGPIAAYTAPEPEPIPVPQIVSRAQGMELLARKGLLNPVEQLLLAGSESDRRAWANIQEFNRASPMLIRLATAIGLTSAMLDDFFIEASAISI